MANFTRANAWNNSGTFDNQDLLWYAKGVRVMQSRQLSDPGSWWFFAAIHNEYVKDTRFPGWGFLPAPPTVSISPAPPQHIWDSYWNQCQHQSWYFLPWHRGYLIALEAQIRADVVDLGGPAAWALPYWDYLGPDDQYKIPPAFAETELSDHSPNPLFVTARYGPDHNGDVFIPTREVIKQRPTDPNFVRGPVTDDFMSNDLFTGEDAKTTKPGFGGVETSFSNYGDTHGNLEKDPHNSIHVYVGGRSPADQEGLMADPGTAALDPIFYLHHANIDRMWTVWNVSLGNPNPDVPKWLEGPASTGDRAFILPMPKGKSWTFAPKEVSHISLLDYTYDHLPPAPPKTASLSEALAERFERLGATDVAAKVAEGVPVTFGTKSELVGATRNALSLGRAGGSSDVQLDTEVRGKVSLSFARASESVPDNPVAPDRIYLNLEGVKGATNASVLSVYVNLPDDAKPADHPELLAGSVALFGLRRASEADDAHGGRGMNFVLDITPIVDRLHLENSLDTDSLHVRIVPDSPLPDNAQISIGRISIYREGQ